MLNPLAAAIFGALSASVLPWLFMAAVPAGRSAWCWVADGKDPAGPTGGIIINSDTFISDPKNTYYADHMSPCCKSASDKTPTYYCFNAMECDCQGIEASTLCTVLMPHDDSLSTVPGRAASCPNAKWIPPETELLLNATALSQVSQDDTLVSQPNMASPFGAGVLAALLVLFTLGAAWALRPRQHKDEATTYYLITT